MKETPQKTALTQQRPAQIQQWCHVTRDKSGKKTHTQNVDESPEGQHTHTHTHRERAEEWSSKTSVCPCANTDHIIRYDIHKASLLWGWCFLSQSIDKKHIRTVLWKWSKETLWESCNGTEPSRLIHTSQACVCATLQSRGRESSFLPPGWSKRFLVKMGFFLTLIFCSFL